MPVQTKPAGVSWLKRFRDFHTLLGLLLAGPIVVVSLTGAYLWYKPRALRRGKARARATP